MEIPHIIVDKLGNEFQLASCIHGAVAKSINLISTRPEFFPEYTDHSASHNAAVIETALSLLTEEAKERLSSRDFATLFLGVLLHDIGMHVTGAGFASLIDPNNNKLTFLDKQTWAELWSEYLLEARRFDGRQLRKIFGRSDPIRVPPDDPGHYTLADRLLIGEFLRRHHPRLAHEIAIFGFPGIRNDRIIIIENAPGDLAELAGIIARSHGMPVRSSIDILEERFHDREYQNIHPPILIAALRIADYLQIQAQRASESYLKLHRIRSPYSLSEWRVHQCIRNITKADADPEAIFIDAAPESVATYLKFRDWSKGLQSELDTTWASLGEVYGRYKAEGFDKFQLKLRRVRTSIDDPATFAKKCNFVPEAIAFDASSPDLLQLLVAPLYGNRPEVGLRELIQNSVDAVLEREFVQRRRPTETIFDRDADVLVKPIYHDEKLTQVIIADRGIGMSVDVIRNYFLKAGASFRSSSSWKKTFTDESGRSEITRTGRFGVGALAAFLIGDKIKIETRRYDSDVGFCFLAELEADNISIEKKKMPIGTTITIDIPESKRKNTQRMFSTDEGKKSWDWYCYEYPSLLRLDLKDASIKPGFAFENSVEWVSVDVNGYNKVLWKAASMKWHHGQAVYPALYCNGIKIRELKDYWRRSPSEYLLVEQKIGSSTSLNVPTILISDKDGTLPVNLQRDNLTDNDENLDVALKNSIAADLVAEAIAKAPELTPFRDGKSLGFKQRSLSCTFLNAQWTGARFDWIWHGSRWLPAEPEIGGEKSWMCVFFDDFDLSLLNDGVLTSTATQIAWQRTQYSADNYEHCSAFVRWISRETFWSEEPEKVGRKFFMTFSEKVLAKLESKKASRHLEQLLSRLQRFGTGYSLSSPNFAHPALPLIERKYEEKQIPVFGFAIVNSTQKSHHKTEGEFPAAWRKYIGATSIPLVYEERRAALKFAFSELGDRIDYHRKKFAN